MSLNLPRVWHPKFITHYQFPLLNAIGWPYQPWMRSGSLQSSVNPGRPEPWNVSKFWTWQVCRTQTLEYSLTLTVKDKIKPLNRVNTRQHAFPSCWPPRSLRTSLSWRVKHGLSLSGSIWSRSLKQPKSTFPWTLHGRRGLQMALNGKWSSQTISFLGRHWSSMKATKWLYALNTLSTDTELRMRWPWQIDVTNHLPFNTSIHFHGIEYDFPPVRHANVRLSDLFSSNLDKRVHHGLMAYLASLNGPFFLDRNTPTNGVQPSMALTGTIRMINQESWMACMVLSIYGQFGWSDLNCYSNSNLDHLLAKNRHFQWSRITRMILRLWKMPEQIPNSWFCQIGTTLLLMRICKQNTSRDTTYCK